jgi:hypothetical protein
VAVEGSLSFQCCSWYNEHYVIREVATLYYTHFCGFEGIFSCIHSRLVTSSIPGALLVYIYIFHFIRRKGNEMMLYYYYSLTIFALAWNSEARKTKIRRRTLHVLRRVHGQDTNQKGREVSLEKHALPPKPSPRGHNHIRKRYHLEWKYIDDAVPHPTNLNMPISNFEQQQDAKGEKF